MNDNISPTGWWIIGLLMGNNDPECSKYWNNLRLFKASSYLEAYEKAVKAGQEESQDNIIFEHPQIFLGITEFLPLYDDFEDGSELMFTEYDLNDEIPSVIPLEVIEDTYNP